MCSDRIDYPALFSYFNQKREDILELIRNQPGLTGWNRRLATQYVESFYAIANNDREAESEIVLACRQMGR